MNDEAILALYFARDEQAVAETDRKYGPYCFTIANAIVKSEPDAEETVSDTWLRAWETIPPRRPQVLKLYLAKITRNLAFSRWRSFTAEKRGGGELTLALEELGECVPAQGSLEEHLAGKELAKAIRAFLDTLPSREQNIFLRRYFFLEESGTIARRYGMKSAAVLKSLSRTRGKLRTYLKKEGFDL